MLEDIPSALEAYQALSAEHRELVFETIGDIGGLTSEYNITNFVSGPIIADVWQRQLIAQMMILADADELSGLSVRLHLVRR